MRLKLTRHSLTVMLVGMGFINTVVAAGEAPQEPSISSSLADWGYILRGALFIFASALAMVWIGRKLSKRKK